MSNVLSANEALVDPSALVVCQITGRPVPFQNGYLAQRYSDGVWEFQSYEAVEASGYRESFDIRVKNFLRFPEQFRNFIDRLSTRHQPGEKERFLNFLHSLCDIEGNHVDQVFANAQPDQTYANLFSKFEGMFRNHYAA